jgi:hypothetical protein
VGGVLAEEAERCRLDAVETVAEVHLVQIQLEDLFLRELAFEPRGHDNFLQFAADRFVAREKALSRELLRDRAAALRGAAFTQVGERRAHDAHEVNARVIVKPLVLNRQERAHEVRRHALDRHLDSLLAIDGECRPVVRVEQRSRLRHRTDVAQHLPIGKAGEDVAREPGGSRDGAPHENGNRDDESSERPVMSSDESAKVIGKVHEFLPAR